MLSETFAVRFYETDALKHVSNTVLAGWFESARMPVFKLFTPQLDLTNWPLILASYKIDFIAQIFYGIDVTVKTGIGRLGGSSFDVYQEVWQSDKLCARGVTTMVHFDYQSQSSQRIPDSIRNELTALLVEGTTDAK